MFEIMAYKSVLMINPSLESISNFKNLYIFKALNERIFSHFQDYLIQYISHQYCNSSQYILSTYNSQHNNNNNVVYETGIVRCTILA
jgi:hypothetical protein